MPASKVSRNSYSRRARRLVATVRSPPRSSRAAARLAICFFALAMRGTRVPFTGAPPVPRHVHGDGGPLPRRAARRGVRPPGRALRGGRGDPPLRHRERRAPRRWSTRSTPRRCSGSTGRPRRSAPTSWACSTRTPTPTPIPRRPTWPRPATLAGTTCSCRSVTPTRCCAATGSETARSPRSPSRCPASACPASTRVPTTPRLGPSGPSGST